MPKPSKKKTWNQLTETEKETVKTHYQQVKHLCQKAHKACAKSVQYFWETHKESDY